MILSFKRTLKKVNQNSIEIAPDDEIELFKYLIVKTKCSMITIYCNFIYELVPKDLQLVSNFFTTLENAVEDMCNEDLSMRKLSSITEEMTSSIVSDIVIQ